MSASNGDRSRFHRLRKQKIARRIRDRAMVKALGTPPKTATRLSSSKPKATIA